MKGAPSSALYISPLTGRFGTTTPCVIEVKEIIFPNLVAQSFVPVSICLDKSLWFAY